MFYDGSNPILKLIGVERLTWEAGVFDVSPRNYAALAFRVSGHTEITANGETHRVSAGEVLYVPQQLGYSVVYEETESVVIHFVTAEDDGAIKTFSTKNAERMRTLFEQAPTAWEEKSAGYYLHTFSVVYNILTELLRDETGERVPKRFSQAVAYMNANFKDRELNIARICNEVGMSQSTFRALFKKHYRKTPVAYITERRLEYARYRIAAGASVENAALESGFNDPKYFSRTVKKYMGCTPRELKTYGK